MLRLCHSTNVIPMTTSISVSWRKIYRQFKVRTRCSCSSSYNVHVRVGILLTCETKLDLPLFFVELSLSYARKVTVEVCVLYKLDLPLFFVELSLS